MSRKKSILIGVGLALVIVIAAVAILFSPKRSQLTFEAIVQELSVQPDGEIRLIVERTTQIYSDPHNSLHIGENTELTGTDGKELSVEDLPIGGTVKVTLEDSFIEENPFYYPTVYEVKVISDKTE